MISEKEMSELNAHLALFCTQKMLALHQIVAKCTVSGYNNHCFFFYKFPQILKNMLSCASKFNISKVFPTV